MIRPSGSHQRPGAYASFGSERTTTGRPPFRSRLSMSNRTPSTSERMTSYAIRRLSGDHTTPPRNLPLVHRGYFARVFTVWTHQPDVGVEDRRAEGDQRPVR